MRFMHTMHFLLIKILAILHKSSNMTKSIVRSALNRNLRFLSITSSRLDAAPLADSHRDVVRRSTDIAFSRKDRFPSNRFRNCMTAPLFTSDNKPIINRNKPLITRN